MSYIVYHESLSSEFLIEEQQYLEYLATGEWFDRPQINEKGNRDETKRLLDEYKKSVESGSYRLSTYGESDLRHSDDQKRIYERRSCEENSIGSSEDEKVIKRRGRPRSK